MRQPRDRRDRRAARRQRGLVLIVALTVVLMMAISAGALIRSVEATLAVAGNLASMNAARDATDAAIEQAVADLFETRRIADLAADDVAHGYSAVRLGSDNARGVPSVLQALANYPPAAPVLDLGDGAVVRYVIERACASTGPPSTVACQLAPAGPVPLAPDASAEPPWVPVYRVTIRVDGPGVASAYAQSWLADLPTGRRMSWRALAD